MYPGRRMYPGSSPILRNGMMQHSGHTLEESVARDQEHDVGSSRRPISHRSGGLSAELATNHHARRRTTRKVFSGLNNAEQVSPSAAGA